MSQPRIDDGGPAFPLGVAMTRNVNHDPVMIDSSDRCGGGMSLRDYFAGKALAGYLVDNEPGSLVNPSFQAPNETFDLATKIARRCYAFADAMIVARKGGAS